MRVICQNDGFVALVPFWAVWPFEILVCSRRHFGSMNELTADEVQSLSDILHRVTSTYDKVFGVPFPYSMGFHQSPTDGAVPSPNAISTPIFIRPCCARRQSANSWSASRCWEPRSATSPPRSPPSACENSPRRYRPRHCLKVVVKQSAQPLCHPERSEGPLHFADAKSRSTRASSTWANRQCILQLST